MKLPTSSFFLVSTLTRGLSWAAQRRLRAAMNSNWALRSEGETVGSCLRLTRREKPAAVSRRATVRGERGKPRAARARASLAVVR